MKVEDDGRDQTRRQAIRLLAKCERCSLQADDLVAWATQLLVEGTESPALIRLAGLDLGCAPNLFEALPIFEQALAELTIDVPRDREFLIRARLFDIAQDLLEARLTAEEALARAHQEVLGPLNHPHDLMPWCDLGDGFDPMASRSLTPGEVAVQVRHLAVQVVECEEGRRTTG